MKYTLLIAFLFLSGTVFSQWINNTTLNNPVSVQPGTQYAPAIISDGKGGAIIAWADDRNGTFDIYAQRIGARGNLLWSTSGVAVCSAAYNQYFPQIVSDGNGGAVIYWTDYRNGGGGFTNTDIYMQRISASGTPLWATDGICISNAANDQNSPHVTAFGTNYLITWNDYRVNSSNGDVYGQLVDASGNALWTPNGKVLNAASGNQLYPKATSDGSSAIVVWQDSRSGNYDIYGQKLDAAGNALWTPTGLPICTAGNTQGDVTLVRDAQDGVIVVWEDYRNGSTSDVYAQRINGNGISQWTTNGVVICSSFNYQENPDITSDNAGGAFITWMDYRNDPAFGNRDIYAQRINEAGVSQWTSNGVAVCNAATHQQYPQIVRDDADGALVSWQDQRSGNWDIYVQKISAAGSMQWTPNGVVAANAANNQEQPDLVTDGKGNPILTWQDSRSGNQDIYATKLNIRLNTDDCGNAAEVTPSLNANPGEVVHSSNAGATQSMTGCVGEAEDDIWFRFTATTAVHTIYVTAAADINPVIEVFSGSCGTFTSLGCRTESDAASYAALGYELTGLTPGVTYYYRTYGQGSNTSSTSIATYISSPGPLPLPVVENLGTLCADASTARARVANPPAEILIAVTLDGNAVDYNSADSSFTYFIAGTTGAGSHTVNVTFDNGTTTAQKEFTYVVTALAVPTFSFGTALSLCGGATVPELPAVSSNGITGTWSPATINNETSGTYTFTPDAGQCASPAVLEVVVNPKLTPSFTFGTTLSICAGADAPTLPLTSENGITGTWSTSTVDNNNSASYTFTPAADQCAVPATLTVTVNPLVTPAFDFGTMLSICAGGTTPSLPNTSDNGITGTWSPAVVDKQASDTYIFTPATGQCAPPLTFTVTVTPVAVPTVTINATASSVCAGTPVTFTAVAANEGTGTWQWKINGINTATTPSLTTASLQNNDVVQLEMTSDVACASPATVVSNSITVQVTALVSPSVSIAGNTTVLTGQASTITATPMNGGGAPAYEWQDSTSAASWTTIPGASGPTINYTPAVNGAKLRAILTSSEACITAATVNSVPLVFTVTIPTSIGSINNGQDGPRLYPNPAVNRLIIGSLRLTDRWETVEVRDLQMNTVLVEKVSGRPGVELNIGHLPSGVYFALLRKRSGEMWSLRFVKL